MAVGVSAVRDWRWGRALEEVKERLGVLFERIEPRRAVWGYIDGLLSGVERKTGWQLAEQAGDRGPWRIQAVLGRGRWDAEAARDLVRSYVVEHLGCEDGVLVVDETGFVKKGAHSVGWRGSTRARPGGSKTARSACSWGMPAGMGTR